MSWLKQASPFSLIPKAVSSHPWYLILYVTSRCNQKCNMCFYWQELNNFKKSQEFTLDEYKKIAQNFPDLFQLTITGGEPTLRDDLADIVEIFYKTCRPRRVTIASNGSRPDQLERL
ncbi:MAG: 4Fe-4S cluster-binding domain-containing protein, partial [Magnetococcales bacterium]|nr:4Fe-4S cluster-binding domain-containing protein [Magnetococcales bacterium]